MSWASSSARLVAYLAEHAAPGALAANRGAETALARACWVLNTWEGVYRSGNPAACTATTVPAMLDAAPDHLVAELVNLAAHAHHAGTLTDLRALAGDPAPGAALGTAGPVFVAHWAGGDLLVGDTLLDVKTVINVRDPAKVAEWLQKLLAYAWLDTTDRYRIRRVGLYLARHGRLITWPLDEFAATLLRIAPNRGPDARRRFLDVAARAAAAEGADARWFHPDHTHVCLGRLHSSPPRGWVRFAPPGPPEEGTPTR